MAGLTKPLSIARKSNKVAPFNGGINLVSDSGSEIQMENMMIELEKTKKMNADEFGQG